MTESKQPIAEPKDPLTPLHWAVYRAIRANTLGGQQPLTQRQLVDMANADMEREGHTERLSWSEKDANHCRALCTICHELNASPQIEKPVRVRKYTYCLGTEQEDIDAALKLRRDALKKLKRASDIMGKVKRNGQGKIVDCHGKALSPDEIDFVEGFVTLEKGVREDAAGAQ